MQTTHAAIKPQFSFPDLKLADVAVSHGALLPMWEANGAIYHISLHLSDSVPQDQLRAWIEERARIDERLKDVINPPSANERARLIDDMREVYNDRVERYLQAGAGECLLRDQRVAEEVVRTLQYNNGKNYALHMYCIMPNHVHVIASGFAKGDLRAQIETWKKVSTHCANRLLRRKGAMWRRDEYTHIIRSQAEYQDQLSYVWHNPETAGLTTGFLRERFV